MAGKGQVFKRHDGKFAFRILAANGQIIATDGGQGYDHRTDAKATLQKLMKGDYDGPVEDA